MYTYIHIILFKLLHVQVLIHYLGNESLAEDFHHGNQKKNSQRNYCKQCPSMRALLKTELSKTNPAEAYKAQVASVKCHPSQMKVFIQRDLKMVNNINWLYIRTNVNLSLNYKDPCL